MACTKAFSFNIASEGDVPLDMAIYVSGINKIIGCRGKWIHKFSATTGELEASMRWATGLINESYITNIGNDVYVAGWRGVVEGYGTSPNYRPDRNVFKVNASTMTLTSTINVAAQGGVLFGDDWDDGFRNIITDGTNLIVYDANQGRYYKFDPTNIAGTYSQMGFISRKMAMLDAHYTTELGGFWFTNLNYTSGTFITALRFSDGSYCTSIPDSVGTSPTFYGVTYSVVNAKAYAVGMDSAMANPLIIKLNTNEILPPAFNNFTYTTLNILGAAARPIRIKYNTVTQLLYVPGWADDTVYIIDPTSDTVVATRTGFSDPIDIVCTPTKTFAVQNSAVGLLAIEEP